MSRVSVICLLRKQHSLYDDDDDDYDDDNDDFTYLAERPHKLCIKIRDQY